MQRVLSVYNTATRETVEEIDISGKSNYEIFALKFKMGAKIEAPMVLLDSREEEKA